MSAYTPPVRLRRHPRVVAGVLAVGLLAALVGLLGGWERDAPDDVRVVGPGVTVGVTPFRFRIDGAEAVYELDGSLADEGLAFIVVEGRLALDADESVSSSVLGDALRADLAHTYSVFGDEQAEAEPQILVAADGSTLLGLGPGLTYDVELVYVVDESAVPDDITLFLLEHIWRKSSLDGEPGWFDPALSARVTVGVAPLPEERPVEEDIL